MTSGDAKWEELPEEVRRAVVSLIITEAWVRGLIADGETQLLARALRAAAKKLEGT